MRRLAFVLAALAAVSAALLAVSPVSAEPGDSSTLTRPGGRIGDPFVVILEVVAPAGASVEVDPAAPSWLGVEVVRVELGQVRPSGDRSIHTLLVTVAPFALGAIVFAPAVNVINGAEVSSRLLPLLTLMVAPTLAQGDPLELSALPPPVAIDGAESPFLEPLLVSGVVVGCLAAALLLFALGRWVTRVIRTRPRGRPAPLPAPIDLDGVAAIIEGDPVGAYRALASVVRRMLSSRYGFAATALTTIELQRRMETHGVDRWLARLVGGLLQECDAVVYAGYRPVSERRHADLTMAREIVEGAS